MESLNNVKVGDLLHWTNGISEGLSRVQKVTKTQIHTRNSAYRKSDGHAIPRQPYSRSYISVPTEETIDKIHSRGIIIGLIKLLEKQALSNEKIFGDAIYVMARTLTTMIKSDELTR